MNVPIVLVGYKSDLRDDRRTIAGLWPMEQKPVSKEQAVRVAKRLGATVYVECSAWTCDGIDHVFEAIVKCIILQDLKRTLGGRSQEKRSWRNRFSPGVQMSTPVESLVFSIPDFDPTSTVTFSGAKLTQSPYAAYKKEGYVKSKFREA